MTKRRKFTLTPPPPRRKSAWRTWRDCCAGLLPAELLSSREREDLVWHLHERGWTDLQIAEHTRMTLYTTARIRARLGLAPHDQKANAA